MPSVEEIVAMAEEATHRAHTAVARLDRSVFRKQIVRDPTPEVWFAHHTTNEAFNALIRSRVACAKAVNASLEGRTAEFEKLCKQCENEANLAVFLATIVEEHLTIVETEPL